MATQAREDNGFGGLPLQSAMHIGLISVRPRQPGERRLLRLSHFHCAFCTPPPPSAQGEGGERSVPENPKEHRWASSMFSFYSEFSVESGSLRAASPGLLVRDTFYTLQECSSLLPAQLICLPREGAKLCIAVEVTCHLQITSTSDGGNCSS